MEGSSALEKGVASTHRESNAMADLTKSRNADDNAIQWPSERIPQGGLFHTPKIEYSKETADLLQALMAESKMSMMMRKKINYHLRNGEPLPKPKSPRVNTKDPEAGALDILRRAQLAKRKNRMPTEKEKKLLQEAMSGMHLAEMSVKAKRKPRNKKDFHATEEHVIDELLEQINERANWLAEMEELGEGKRFRNEVREQIAERLRHIKALETKFRLKTVAYVSWSKGIT
ncbi:unnamed protein product [Ceratitis capitata]|uniref:(Mediterranean fruit fly) hypothetical protein n=1 Tax=Ceratitis capitata TaxID=7213 RepID=A0A811V1S5_CERCA|nr:unnamed protein product [Ceratitis capitata]